MVRSGQGIVCRGRHFIHRFLQPIGDRVKTITTQLLDLKVQHSKVHHRKHRSSRSLMRVF